MENSKESELWIKRENGESVQLQDSPGTGSDSAIVGTIYRWWHEGLPPKLKEGLIDEDDLEQVEGNVKHVTDAQYKKWLSRLEPKGDLERVATNAVQEEINLSMLKGITDALFGNKASGKASKTCDDSIAPEELTEDVIRALFSDLQEHIDAKNTDGLMKHFSKNFKIKITSSESGKKNTMTLNHLLYRLSYKITFSPEMQFKSNHEIQSIKIDGDKAVVKAIDSNEYFDPVKKKKVRGVSEDTYELEIVDGKVKIVRGAAIQTTLH